ncbi:MAG: S8 family peptidase [Caulobacterales bacterium]
MKKLLLAGVMTSALLNIVTPALAQPAAPATVRPFHGNISPFHGNISPFYGNISPFHGNISPFYGNIAPFWGNISPFHGNIAPFWGNISPFHGNISPFWGNIAPFWGNISPFTQQLQTNWSALPTTGAAGQTALRNQMRELVKRSETFWGASVTSRTGQTFWNGFASRVFAKYGIDLNRPETLAGVSDADRARFMFDWYDGLMQFSGRDQADHWMVTARWNPALTQQQGMGQGTKIGLIDVAIDSSVDAAANVTRAGGNATVVNSHGAAVAGIMVGAHDNRGVMGIAPMASIVQFNPFDNTGTTDWETVARGVLAVTNAGASVVNLSLGVPGSTLHSDFKFVYTNRFVAPALSQTVFVQAAGNEGVSQTQNVAWDFNPYPHLLLVGSVGPSEQISTFSNRPGTACFVRNTKCVVPLMKHFIVAPGEWILVNDGAGGVTRQSGTSFAAPMVTGAIALLHDRWPWLRNDPGATVEIILRSAKDLGAPGVDPVYGVGLLDITASQSPRNFDLMYFYTAGQNGLMVKTDVDTKRTATGAERQIWSTSTGFRTLYEDTGASFRDFLIPMEANLVSATVNGRTEAMQYYLQQAFLTWGNSFVQERKLSEPGQWDLRFGLSPLATDRHVRDGALPFNVGLTGETVGGMTFKAGHGDGALALSAGAAQQAVSVDLNQGGVNPLLGLASGGVYVGAGQKLPAGFALEVGFTERETQPLIVNPVSREEQALNQGVDPYQAAAANVSLRQQVTPEMAWSIAFSFLNERAALLGVQSLRQDDFAVGAQTDAVTLGVEWAPRQDITFSASATHGKTRAQDAADQALAVGENGMTTTAFEASVSVSGIALDSDRARLRLAQPLYLEKGSLAVTDVQVVDRSSGRLGVVTQKVDLTGGDRRLIVEGMYSKPFLNGLGEVAAFARMDSTGAFDAPGSDNVLGASFKLRF